MSLLRVNFPYDIGAIHRRILSASSRHANACREEIITLRAELARRDQQIETLQKQLSLSNERRNDNHP